ncbi:hypothetical protein [Flavobacterium sp.]|uniref:hypothetical protein n=1 Tax=Flavobacterium sp. TaxID=239 RepID=UPI000EE42FC3|nr:hypothetical protein [Flavobacterium sp.]HCQ12599.1 hypothetical protein [Flavobacterium sp.]
MKNILSALVVASVLFVSCKKEETAVAPEANKEESVFSDSFSGPIDTAAVPAATATTPATNGNPTMMTTTQTATVAAPAPVAKGMNPAHGQPGHRCEIPVGAPLNSAPGKASVQPIKSTSTTISSSDLKAGTVTTNGATITTVNNNPTPNAGPIAPTVTAPGMNPPHGQEGHDCAVAVGAPLPKK